MKIKQKQKPQAQLSPAAREPSLPHQACRLRFLTTGEAILSFYFSLPFSSAKLYCIFLSFRHFISWHLHRFRYRPFQISHYRHIRYLFCIPNFNYLTVIVLHNLKREKGLREIEWKWSFANGERIDGGDGWCGCPQFIFTATFCKFYFSYFFYLIYEKLRC